MKRISKLVLALCSCAALLSLTACANDNVNISTVNDNSILNYDYATIGDTSVEVNKNQAWSEADDLNTEGAVLELDPGDAISGHLSITMPGNAPADVEADAPNVSVPKQ